MLVGNSSVDFFMRTISVSLAFNFTDGFFSCMSCCDIRCMTISTVVLPAAELPFYLLLQPVPWHTTTWYAYQSAFCTVSCALEIGRPSHPVTIMRKVLVRKVAPVSRARDFYAGGYQKIGSILATTNQEYS